MDRALKERIIGAIVLVAIVVLVVPVFLDGPAPDEEAMISQPVLLPGQSREPGERRTVVLQRDRDQPLPDGSPQDATHPVDAAAAGDETPEPAATVEPEDPPRTDQGASDEGASDQSASDRGAADQGAADQSASDQGAPDQGASGETVAAAALESEDPAPTVEEPAEAPAQPASRPEPAETEAAAESATGMWAVQIGSFSNKANADRLAVKLREDGYAAFLSQHRGASGELHRVRIGPQEDRESAEAVAARLSADGFTGQVVPHP